MECGDPKKWQTFDAKAGTGLQHDLQILAGDACKKGKGYDKLQIKYGEQYLDVSKALGKKECWPDIKNCKETECKKHDNAVSCHSLEV